MPATVPAGTGDRRPQAAVEVAGSKLGSPFRSLIRLALYFLFTLVLMPTQAIALLLGVRSWLRIPMWYHEMCRRLLGFELEIQGTMTDDKPVLFVSNHSSYLDITILGSIVPASFVAKSEVAKWPLFGWLAKLQRTVFVDRRRRTTHNQRDEMGRRLHAGDSLILFPEGTSNDGNRILPFRSALFSVAERGVDGAPLERHLTIQPLSLAYTHLNGIPIGRAYRPYLAWYGDMSLFGHLWRVAGLGRVTVRVNFHEPVDLARFGSRKALSSYCQDTISAGVAAALAGRRAAIAADEHKIPVKSQMVSRPAGQYT
jgi:1-acyl-sn-glycerol-3-phosphate acyltransferase